MIMHSFIWQVDIKALLLVTLKISPAGVVVRSTSVQLRKVILKGTKCILVPFNESDIIYVWWVSDLITSKSIQAYEFTTFFLESKNVALHRVMIKNIIQSPQ